ncbi:Structural maintenance of chromosomes protein 2-2 [Zea mays]|uniref:Structural maintenance of chromosomes protein 2-2 n=1 Tax=Zea mays TaxID=4577 RepID=A0A1D6N472_MAIZE|nr:Structural maintenance of chromosomes protein 2-2 [Zea mays]
MLILLIQVAFNRQISSTSVTLEGDTYQPSGLLTGGSKGGRGNLLRKLDELAKAEADLSDHEKKLFVIEQQVFWHSAMHNVRT